MTRRPSSWDAARPMKGVSSVLIRRLRAGDIEQAARRCFPDDDFDTIVERFQDELETQEAGHTVTLVAEHDSRVCGVLKLDSHARTGWIHNMAVAPDMRGGGVAGLMLEAAADEAARRGFEKISLHVRSTNASAIRAYEKAGYRFAAVDGMRGEQLRYIRMLRVTSDE